MNRTTNNLLYGFLSACQPRPSGELVCRLQRYLNVPAGSSQLGGRIRLRRMQSWQANSPHTAHESVRQVRFLSTRCPHDGHVASLTLSAILCPPGMCCPYYSISERIQHIVGWHLFSLADEEAENQNSQHEERDKVPSSINPRNGRRSWQQGGTGEEWQP